MIQIDDRLCTGCGACAEFCPRRAIRIVDGGAVVDSATCDDCGRCVPVCPQDAILWVEVVAPEAAGKAAVVRQSVPSASVPRVPTRAAAVWPLVGSALLWAGREVVPRVADLALDLLLRRAAGGTAVRSASPFSRPSRSGGARHRQRQRRGGG
jgi:Fe-S-cluster-containing hydrogenase component 2